MSSATRQPARASCASSPEARLRGCAAAPECFAEPPHHFSRFGCRDAADAFQRTFEWPALRRSLVVALIVGTMLNLINQGPELFSGGRVVLWKALLSHVVPFLVASYGSYAASRSGR